MPLIDMPIDKLEKYNGVNPKPTDFDEYWEKALTEMRAVASQVTITKATFQTPTIECFDMYFTGVNGAKIYVKHLRPKNVAGKIPAVLRFHGYKNASEDWFGYLGFASAGVAVFAMDVRGQGGKSEDVGGVCGNTIYGHISRGLDEKDPQKLLYRDIFLDTAQLAGIVMDMDFIDETNVYTFGGSQGGALAIACAALEPRIARVAARYPFLCDYKRVWDMDLAENAYAELREYFRRFDPRHEREEEVFTKLGYIDLQYLAPRIRASILVFTGLMDKICPPSTQYAMYNKLVCPKRHVIYPDYGHEAMKDVYDITFDFLINNQ